MLELLRIFVRLVELIVSVPVKCVRLIVDWVIVNPKLGPLRYLATAALAYLVFAAFLVYGLAPFLAWDRSSFQSEKLHYDAERWLATAIYDAGNNFVGTFAPELDSRRDVNYGSEAIEVGGYTANPDHKSIPVRTVPEHFWKCLLYHEDRRLGGVLNPHGIDLIGVLKIPYTTIARSIRLGRPSLGIGGSTLPMQFARVIYKTPPRVDETPLDKLARKFSEWRLAPIIYHELTKDGDDEPLKRWAANHLWLAQRTGGASLYGVEVASQIVFGKEAKDLSIAEQFVLASAVNKPVILLEGTENLNAVRLDRWRSIAEVRARVCAEKLINEAEVQRQVVFDLVNLAGGPPDPQVKPALQSALETYAPDWAKRAEANPVIRANTLMPAARFGIREEMKQTYGYDWRNHVRGVTTSFDAAENLAYRTRVREGLKKINKKYAARINAGYTLDPDKRDADTEVPNVIVVAANSDGEIVRYFDTGETATYFGSVSARAPATGLYESKLEPRMLASTGKVIAAIALANEMKDSVGSLYLDTAAPARGLETCTRNGSQRRGRRAIVAFACSLNEPLVNRLAQVGQGRVARIIKTFGFNMPPKGVDGEGTPPSTAAVLGQISGSPRRVHQMSGVVLASLIGRDRKPVGLPSLVKTFDYTTPEAQKQAEERSQASIVPKSVIARGGRRFLRSVLQAPVCYQANGRSHGTLKSLSHWCASRRSDLRLHFSKTGTQVGIDRDATIDVWATGGLQFSNGAAYSYVVLVGTGATNKPWARALHSSQVAAPLLDILLSDLARHAKENPQIRLLPRRRRQSPAPVATGSVSEASSNTESAGELHLRALRGK